MNCLIPLTQGQFAIVDQCDFERVNAFKWHARWHASTNSFYAQRGLPRNGGRQVPQQMHRFIVDAPKGVKIDHINGDTLDNRRSNLRVATNSQNTMNSRRRRNNRSGYKGVSAHKGKWDARIVVDGKCIYLGGFKTPEEAHEAYKAAAITHHKEFARFE